MAGLVVVASAGNWEGRGRRRSLRQHYHAGCGAERDYRRRAQHLGTETPDDDTITTYSSRGPTRFDLGLKPDVVAPGNKIVSLRAPGSFLYSQYPDLHVAGSGHNAYLRMSGTSMAAGMVSGGAALLLEGGALTARQIKLAMQLSASFMPDAGLLRAGLGRVNLYSARRVNSAVTTLTGIVPSVTIAGRTVKPSGHDDGRAAAESMASSRRPAPG